MEKPYPTSLGNPPLLEMIVEFRFQTSLPDEALFGLYYPVIHKTFPNYIPLPIMNIPHEVRTKDPALIHQPNYHFFGDNDISLLIGPRVLTFKYERYRNGKTIDYPGWRKYIADFVSKLTIDIFGAITPISIERIGMRYLDFLDDIKLRDYITPSFDFPNRKLERVQVTCSVVENEIIHNINLSDSAEFKHHVEGNLMVHKLGSLIDIDSEYKPESIDSFLDKIKELLTIMHDGNKNLFYEIMKDELVNMYNPIFEGGKK
jgi:uncharacterized protein (TIGR04255 family)